MRTTILLLLTLPFFIASCDKVDEPFPENLNINDSAIVWDDSVTSESNTGERYVLMEEFTGHTCNNCPAAAAEIDRLKNKKYGKKFIPIAIHASDFAKPYDDSNRPPGYPDGSYTQDHRTDESLEYESVPVFEIAALPKGLVCRIGRSLPVSKWVQECDAVYNNPGQTVANIHIQNFFDDSSKVFKVDVSIEWLVDYQGDMNLQVQVLEDSVVGWQLDGATDIEDYVFKHMFRGSVNGAWGSPIKAAKAGSRTETSFTRSIENYLGRGNSLANFLKSDFTSFSIVAYLYKRSPEYEVMQVNEAHLTEHTP